MKRIKKIAEVICGLIWTMAFCCLCGSCNEAEPISHQIIAALISFGVMIIAHYGLEFIGSFEKEGEK